MMRVLGGGVKDEPQRLKPLLFALWTARLKPCPDERLLVFGMFSAIDLWRSNEKSGSLTR
jgi:hypothetical protein